MSKANISADSDEQPCQIASAIDVASMPWAFTQQQPLDTRKFVTEATQRGFALDIDILRELYRHNLITPFVYVSTRRVGHVPETALPERPTGNTNLENLRYARDRGRLIDLATVPFRPKLRFERRATDSEFWWNGLLYSQYQLLVLPELRDILYHRRLIRHNGKIITRLPTPHQSLLDRVACFRSFVIALTALETRYLPALDSGWLHLVNTDVEEWEQYRQTFDPVAVSQSINYSAANALHDAEWLLQRAHRLDPLEGAWRSLMRRIPRDKWNNLRNDALLAMEYREAAEILLQFYEDLVNHEHAAPLPEIPYLYWHPLHERLSYRHETLDQNLMHLGISPHPRVVLAVEGETEQVHVPQIWKELGYPNAPELIRLLTLRGADRDMEKVAALAAAPLVAGKAPGRQNFWMLIKPPTCLFIAADPEGKFSPSSIEDTKRNILGELFTVLRAQGVINPKRAEVEALIKIHTWSDSSYEYAHFTDEELADGIMAVHDTINGWTKSDLINAISYWRGRKEGIKKVWERGRWDEQRHRPTGGWEYAVSKTKLANALWPVLKAKIDRCRANADEPVPEIVQVVQTAYHLAQQWRYQSFVLTEEVPSPNS